MRKTSTQLLVYEYINRVLANYAKKAEPYSEVKELREKGLSFREIAKKLNINYSTFLNRAYILLGPSPVTSKCYSCGTNVIQKNKKKFSFCLNCWNMFFTRTTGSDLRGMDFVREIVRIRDKHTCIELAGGCGKIWKLGERRFDIHHWDGSCGKKSREYDRVENINNLITLCHKCHLNLPEVKDKMKNKSSPRLQRQKNYQKQWVKDNLKA